MKHVNRRNTDAEHTRHTRRDTDEVAGPSNFELNGLTWELSCDTAGVTPTLSFGWMISGTRHFRSGWKKPLTSSVTLSWSKQRQGERERSLRGC